MPRLGAPDHSSARPRDVTAPVTDNLVEPHPQNARQSKRAQTDRYESDRLAGIFPRMLTTNTPRKGRREGIGVRNTRWEAGPQPSPCPTTGEKGSRCATSGVENSSSFFIREPIPRGAHANRLIFHDCALNSTRLTQPFWVFLP